MKAVDRSRRGQLLAQYKGGHGEVTEALAGISEAELDARPITGQWTAREIVHHLADSEMTSAFRLRRLLAEEQPAILAYDEEAFARHLHYDRPIAASLDALRAARQTTADILDRLSEAEWAKEGTHNEVGRYSVETWLEIYAAHGHDHAEQIRRARRGPGNISL
jgi:hypothetical protein